MKKILGFIAALVLMITLLPLQQAEASAVNKHFTVSVETLDVRENPTPRAKVVGSLKKGAVVFVYNTAPGGWSKIKYTNKAGYIATSGLQQNGSSSPSKSNAVNKHFTVTVNALNVSEKPSPKAKIVGSLKKGTVVFVYNTEPGGWSKIKYNNKAGYVASSYLKGQGGANPAPQAGELSSFFLKNEQTASFLGDGMEYTSYTTRTVWHDREHVTVYTDNGGTVVARTFRIEANRIVMVREKVESYEDYVPTKSELRALKTLSTYLQLPLKKGATFAGWVVKDDSATLKTPLRTFNNVIVIEKSDTEGNKSRLFFVKGYGEVKSQDEYIYDHSRYVVSSVIEWVK